MRILQRLVRDLGSKGPVRPRRGPSLTGRDRSGWSVFLDHTSRWSLCLPETSKSFPKPLRRRRPTPALPVSLYVVCAFVMHVGWTGNPSARPRLPVSVSQGPCHARRFSATACARRDRLWTRAPATDPPDVSSVGGGAGARGALVGVPWAQSLRCSPSVGRSFLRFPFLSSGDTGTLFGALDAPRVARTRGRGDPTTLRPLSDVI